MSRTYYVILLKQLLSKLLECSRTLCKYIKTDLCSSRASYSCCCRSEDCFESSTEKELPRKIAHFKALWRQQ